MTGGRLDADKDLPRAALGRRGAIAGSVGLALAACAPQAERGMTLAPGKLRIGTYFVNPPFEYVADGQRIGFEVDLMNDVSRRLSLERFPI